MELKWTSKALSDLSRVYDFLALSNSVAAARVVQTLTKAPMLLLIKNPRMGEQLFQFIARDLADMGISGRRFALNIDVTPATAGNSNCCCIR
ncbi:type II toxin-antitoxin system RelE/ParE family toxin (plasmid) [Providencia alcalifaciens]|uniref:type II toxin-antitoxin system RelE/ParE family toxin n=1 Tax=Providencia alcalifaciens TaxID=126385 RepID=UPI00249EDFC4|nr:type II toxin-antitoxin system RelE/ParE family toxin [Providencia alcalifaciens]WGZ56489.1 type II toxin-antitoxin system RelE/ParE family toxin [Providencia alcalifaciens]